MKGAALRVIEAWQQNPNRVRGLCLRSPTCSAYGYQAISRYGLIRGGVMTAWRVLTCNSCMTRRARSEVTGARTTGRSAEKSC
jgi:uncharacterized protein